MVIVCTSRCRSRQEEGLQLYSLPLIKQLLGMELVMDDLLEIDATLRARILDLRSFTDEELANLELDFTIDDVNFGKRRKVDLVMGGEELQVTKGNVEVYIRLYMERHLRCNTHMLACLTTGLHKFCPKLLMRAASECFTVAEFDMVLSATQVIDIEDWQQHTRYEGCSSRSNVVKLFWDVMRSLTQAEQRRVLRFATGQSTVPVGGFRMLKSGGEIVPFTMALGSAPHSGNARSNYPTAATCSNQLSLPRYSDQGTLKKFLLLAVRDEMLEFEEMQ
jgi:E3 ubiquitin-protein ligase HUWE1